MAKLINQDNYGYPIVDKNGVPTQSFYNLISALCDLEILDGTGTPEGNTDINAKFKTLYLDTAASKVYIKTTDYGVYTGWVALN